MPIPLTGSQMVLSPTMSGVLVIGGFDDNKKIYSKQILQYSGDKIENFQWNILDKSLIHPRFNHVSFLISNELKSQFISNLPIVSRI